VIIEIVDYIQRKLFIFPGGAYESPFEMQILRAFREIGQQDLDHN